MGCSLYLVQMLDVVKVLHEQPSSCLCWHEGLSPRAPAEGAARARSGVRSVLSRMEQGEGMATRNGLTRLRRGGIGGSHACHNLTPSQAQTTNMDNFLNSGPFELSC